MTWWMQNCEGVFAEDSLFPKKVGNLRVIGDMSTSYTKYMCMRNFVFKLNFWLIFLFVN